MHVRRKEPPRRQQYVLGDRWFGSAKTTALHKIVADEHFWHLEAVRKQVWELEHSGQEDMLNAQDGAGRTPLFLAAQAGRLEIVRYLVDDKGVDTLIAACDGTTPALAAVLEGMMEVTKWLFSRGCTTLRERTSRGETAIHLAARGGHAELVRFLLTEAMVDPDAKTVNHKTAAMIAAHHGHSNVLRVLLEFGANILSDGRRSQDPAWSPPALIAAAEGYLSCLEALDHYLTASDWAAFSRSGDSAVSRVARLPHRLSHAVCCAVACCCC